MTDSSEPEHRTLRARLFQIIFESDTPLAKGFDLALIAAILISVLVVMLDSVPHLNARYGFWFAVIEWTFTGLFTLEYLLRLYCLDRPLRYARGVYGIIDLLSILPSWLSLVIPGGQSLLVVRILRIMRLFRVLRLMEFVGEGNMLLEALKRSRQKILVFLITVMALVTIFGAILYLIEPHEAGFTSIPRSMYWAIVTLTTVGYGDITPVTPVGQIISALMMIIGYSILAVPTGVFSAEVMRSIRRERYSEEACPGCGHEGHERDAKYCRLCGTWLDEDSEDPHREEQEKERASLEQESERLREESETLKQERRALEQARRDEHHNGGDDPSS
ncbi:voltage-gated potassium channel [Kushneria sinocarnis]|uniref:Voltage-gated potassium channel n=1 Tax=Kushneria sinocarnis TaxID=595502 RepID=A0A420WZV0_9GAMM|nr:ion transporter [Kushneria sinocarnis]RKR06735.1 voltage-gated potassium channel [Kushneria sinocarnis]